MVVVTVIFAIITPMTFFFFSSANSDKAETQKVQVEGIGDSLTTMAEDMYMSPGLSKRHTKFDIPDNVRNISLEGRKTLVFEIGDEGKKEHMIFDSDVPIAFQSDESLIAGGYITLYKAEDAVAICVGECDCNASEAGYCNDNVDNDCDGWTDICDNECPGTTDADGDGWTLECGIPDCNDSRSDVHPNAYEICGDGIDQDCDGFDKACPNSTACGSCASLGYECGIQTDGCFMSIDCGSCSGAEVCINAQCCDSNYGNACAGTDCINNEIQCDGSCGFDSFSPYGTPCNGGADTCDGAGNCCTLDSYSACYSGDRYWYDSCNNLGAQREACSYGCVSDLCCGSNYGNSCGSNECVNEEYQCDGSCGFVSNEPITTTCSGGAGNCDGAGNCCVSDSYSACYSGDRYWYDSCNNLGAQREACSYGCDSDLCCGSNYGNSCGSNECVNEEYQCDGSCGFVSNVSNGVACTGGTCDGAGNCVPSCTTHSYSGCDSGDRWWYNSCGVKEDKRENCNYGCSSNKCLAKCFSQGGWLPNNAAKECNAGQPTCSGSAFGPTGLSQGQCLSWCTGLTSDHTGTAICQYWVNVGTPNCAIIYTDGVVGWGTVNSHYLNCHT